MESSRYQSNDDHEPADTIKDAGFWLEDRHAGCCGSTAPVADHEWKDNQSHQVDSERGLSTDWNQV